MRIGQLRKSIILQAETSVSDGAGGYALGWTDVATVWGEIKPVTGREVYASQHQEGRVTHEISLRYRSDVMVTSNMRAVYGGRFFNIRAVMNQDERNRWTALLVEEGGPV
jgi:SPP1 family predicted phage head-tail adaptor